LCSEPPRGTFLYPAVRADATERGLASSDGSEIVAARVGALCSAPPRGTFLYPAVRADASERGPVSSDGSEIEAALLDGGKVTRWISVQILVETEENIAVTRWISVQILVETEENLAVTP
jgi:hypothetical protein